MVLITVIFIVVLFVSCNKNVCPAYVMDVKSEKVENNG
jgi:hypothetical protein